MQRLKYDGDRALELLRIGTGLPGARFRLGQPLPEPVLLVDDIVGSRWTFTVTAWLLRRLGSGEVWPLAVSSLTGS
jgi:hypothetical protein